MPFRNYKGHLIEPQASVGHLRLRLGVNRPAKPEDGPDTVSGSLIDVDAETAGATEVQATVAVIEETDWPAGQKSVTAQAHAPDGPGTVTGVELTDTARSGPPPPKPPFPERIALRFKAPPALPGVPANTDLVFKF